MNLRVSLGRLIEQVLSDSEGSRHVQRMIDSVCLALEAGRTVDEDLLFMFAAAHAVPIDSEQLRAIAEGLSRLPVSAAVEPPSALASSWGEGPEAWGVPFESFDGW